MQRPQDQECSRAVVVWAVPQEAASLRRLAPLSRLALFSAACRALSLTVDDRVAVAKPGSRLSEAFVLFFSKK